MILSELIFSLFLFKVLIIFSFESVVHKNKSKPVKSEIKQETLRVVTITMICFTLLHFENFNISGGLYITQLKICDGAFIAKIVSR